MPLKLFCFMILGIGIAVLSLVVSYAEIAPDANCDFVKRVTTGLPSYVFSPNYPFNYTSEVFCRWIVVCQDGYNCRINCRDVILPQSPSCSLDRLLVSKTGDNQFTSASSYCGRRPFSTVSTGTKIGLALIAPANSTGGRFSCDVSAQLRSR